MGRGVLLLAVALLIGVVLLNATDEQPPGADLAAGSSSQGDDGGDGGGGPTTTGAPATTAAPAKAPADVKVLVVNASDVKGAAGTATEQLKAKAYNALAPGNVAKVAESVVYFTADFDREGAAIAELLGIGPALVKAIPTPAPTDIKTANVLVVLGADHAARFGAAGATTTTAAGAATTTAKPAATTTTTR